MKISSTLTPTLPRSGLCAALVLLAGCASAGQPVVEVTSPPPPRVGSGPIMAYDAYARALFFPPSGSEAETRITTVDRPAVKSRLLIGEKRRVAGKSTSE